MDIQFADRGTEDIYHNRDSKVARKTLPRDVWRSARRKLMVLSHATKLDDVRFPPGNRLEALKGERKGQHSIRINHQYRICFRWTEAGPKDVEITDYH